MASGGEGGGERIKKPEIIPGSALATSKRLAFDLEGPLVDLEKFHQLAFEQVAKELGVQFGSKEFHSFVGAGDAAISTEIARLSSSPDFSSDPNVIREAKMRIYKDLLHSHRIEARPGVGEYLERAKLIGGDLVLATLTPDKDAQRILQEAHLLPFFKHVLTETSVQKKKPDPEIYIKAAHILKTPNRDMIVHEDSPTGVAAGKAAGSPVAAFPVHENLKFNPEPDVIYMGWNGLTPDEVIERIFGDKKIA